MKKFNELKWMIGTFTMAFDQWLMVICLIHVFGRSIPWYVWAIAAAELITVIVSKVCYKLNIKFES